MVPVENTYSNVGFRIVGAARPVGAGLCPQTSVASGPSSLLTTGGVNIGPSLYLATNFTRLRAQAPA